MPPSSGCARSRNCGGGARAARCCSPARLAHSADSMLRSPRALGPAASVAPPRPRPWPSSNSTSCGCANCRVRQQRRNQRASAPRCCSRASWPRARSRTRCGSNCTAARNFASRRLSGPWRTRVPSQRSQTGSARERCRPSTTVSCSTPRSTARCTPCSAARLAMVHLRRTLRCPASSPPRTCWTVPTRSSTACWAGWRSPSTSWCSRRRLRARASRCSCCRGWPSPHA